MYVCIYAYANYYDVVYINAIEKQRLQNISTIDFQQSKSGVKKLRHKKNIFCVKKLICKKNMEFENIQSEGNGESPTSYR